MFDPMTMIRLQGICEQEFEKYVAHLFKERRMYCSRSHCQTPVIGGGTYNVNASASKERQQVMDALRSQYLFHLIGPAWAPRLPLEPEEIEVMLRDPDPRHRTVALFSEFLQDGGWQISRAYDFPDFVRGLLANPQTAPDIRTNQQLRKEFSPKAEARAG
jgi:hypothetical protein